MFASHPVAANKMFLSAAARYWIDVFPSVRHEIRLWEQAAREIPDPLLKMLALKALHDERGNLEGAAAYAAITPHRYRPAVTRATIAFQAVYDYVDALSEQPDSDPKGTRRLHQALLVALKPGGPPHQDYYQHNARREDGGYLDGLIDRCRAAVSGLPSFPGVALQIERAASRIVTYQCLNHQGPGDSYRAFACWARKETSRGSDLRWWETGAAAGSSLSVFALISAAAQPALPAEHVNALERAYLPWICSLHTLLDSLIDEREDSLTNQHCLAAHYASDEETASRLQLLAIRARERTKALPDSERHMMILAAMVSFYLTNPRSRDPRVKLAAEAVLAVFGGHATPAMFVLRTRNTVKYLTQGSDRCDQ